MNILIDTAYLMFIFWFGSLAAFDGIYKLDIENDLEICTIVRNKKGKAVIKLNGPFLTIGNTIFFLTSVIYGGIALLIQSGLYALLNGMFHINLEILLADWNGEYAIAFGYGWLIVSGFYAGRAFLSYFAAQQVLKYINRSYQYLHPKNDLTIFKVLEENLQREESRLNKKH